MLAPYFFLVPAVAPHFLNSRNAIATDVFLYDVVGSENDVLEARQRN